MKTEDQLTDLVTKILSHGQVVFICPIWDYTIYILQLEGDCLIMMNYILPIGYD
jgi:hypothetical protein